VHFLYRDPKAAKESEKLAGFQRCSPVAVPAKQLVQVCHLDYASGATDIEVNEAVAPACSPVASPPAAGKKAKPQ
jgi:hypothetical protein